MSLILAVEPDKRQAKQLSSVVRQQVRGGVGRRRIGRRRAGRAGHRVPDLILTPALLPPKDEAVLTGWLRDMGDAAAHVQTLAIPILAEPVGAEKEKDPGRRFSDACATRRRTPARAVIRACSPIRFACISIAPVPNVRAGTATGAAPTV